MSMEVLEAGPGHNLPPAPTVFEIIDDLHTEAMAWCDGTGALTDEQAVDIGLLIDMLNDARKTCEAEYNAKVKPLDDAKAAIKTIYDPAIAKAKSAIKETKVVRDIYLKQKQAAIDEAARKAREEAEALKRAADDEIRRTRGNLEEREAAERKLEEAKAAEYKAIAMAKATPPNIGGRKSVSKKWETTISDPVAAANYCWQNHKEEMLALVLTLGKRDVTAGKREIPGFNIVEVV